MAITRDDLLTRFAHHPPSSEEVAMRHAEARRKCFLLAEALMEDLPSCREQSTAMTKLEELMMWWNAGIARTQ